MREIWFYRVGGSLMPTDDDSRKVIERMSDGECKAFRPIGVRDPVMHRRYWALCGDLPRKASRIEIDRMNGKPVYMPIRSKEDAHAAFKLCTGLFDVLPVEGTDFAIRVPHSTNFERMTPEE